MSLYSRGYGSKATKTPLVARERMLLFVKALRRFTEAQRQSNTQEKLNKVRNRSCRFEDGNQACSHSDLPRSSVHAGLRHHSKTIAGGCGGNARRIPTIDTDLQPQVVKRSKCECTLFSEASTSKSFSSSVAEVFGKIRGIFYLSKAVMSVYITQTNAFRMHSATCGESIFSRYISKTIEASSLRRHLSVLASVFRPLGHFETHPQSNLEPSTALCAVSQ